MGPGWIRPVVQAIGGRSFQNAAGGKWGGCGGIACQRASDDSGWDRCFEAETKRAEEHRKRADELYLENLQLQKELWRYKKATYGPRADRLSENELAQALLEFAEELEQKPLPAESLPQGEAKPE